LGQLFFSWETNIDYMMNKDGELVEVNKARTKKDTRRALTDTGAMI